MKARWIVLIVLFAVGGVGCVGFLGVVALVLMWKNAKANIEATEPFNNRASEYMRTPAPKEDLEGKGFIKGKLVPIDRATGKLDVGVGRLLPSDLKPQTPDSGEGFSCSDA